VYEARLCIPILSGSFMDFVSIGEVLGKYGEFVGAALMEVVK
jgi:hypothetical protein